MEFGVGLLPKYPFPQIAHLAKQCEDWGYSSIWVPDERFFRECYSYMTAIAMSTSRVSIGTAVTDPYSRHPAMTAAALATLDEISGGRVILGLGAGVSGMRQMRFEQPKPARAMRETIEVVRRLLRGETVTFDGEIVQTTEAKLDFKPVRSDLPLWIVGAGPAVLKTAGRVADGVMMGDYAGPRIVKWGLEQVEAGAKETGRSLNDLKKSVWLQTWVHKDGKIARDNARWFTAVILWIERNYLAKMGTKLPDDLAEALSTMTYSISQESMKDIAPLVTDELLYEYAMAGTPSEVVAQSRELEKAGIDLIAFHVWDVADQPSETTAELIAREVLPYFR